MGLATLEAFCRQTRPLYIYGAGGYGRMLMAYLTERGIEVSGFVETTTQSGKYVMGHPVKGLGDISGACGFVLGVGQRYEDEIRSNLQRVGFQDFFSVSSDLMRNVQRHTQYHEHNIIRTNVVNVLLYHRIAELETDVWNIAVHPKRFEEHIRFIKSNYPVLRFEEDWSSVREKSVVITFDDGYVDNYRLALPILEKYQVPATFFVSTGNLGTIHDFWWDRLERIFLEACERLEELPIGEEKMPMKWNNGAFGNLKVLYKKLRALVPNEREKVFEAWEGRLRPMGEIDPQRRTVAEDELKRMAAFPLVTIGAHTVTHSVLAQEPDEMQRWEIATSKSALEDIIGRKVEVFSYPFGGRRDFTQTTVQILRECGYMKAAANWRGTANGLTDPFRIPRNAVWDGGVEECARQIRGTWAMFGDT